MTAAGQQTLERFDYRSEDLRFSVSWKAYCFADGDDLARWRTHSEDLEVSQIKDLLVDELVSREASTAPLLLSDTDLALLMIDTFVRFPAVRTEEVRTVALS